MDRRQLSLDAEQEALKTRRRIKCALLDAVCPFDAVDTLDVELRFVDLPKSEGVFIKDPGPVIIVSSMRPTGRSAFTCAHELGHFRFGHGTRYEELATQPLEMQADDQDEFLADRFASYFLMPKITVANGFVRRGWQTKTCTPEQVHTVSGWLGVGYATLVHHMARGIGLITRAQAGQLLRSTPKHLRTTMLPASADSDLYVVDAHWTGRAVDAHVGDHLLLPLGTTLIGECVRQAGEYAGRLVFTASLPGVGQFIHPSGWASYVRVSRQGYVGRGKFRHLEDPDFE